MLLIDTSVWIPVYRDASGAVAQLVLNAIGKEEFVFCQFIRAELLQGCRDEREWARTVEYLDDQSYLEMSVDGWTEAARIYFELRQRAHGAQHFGLLRCRSGARARPDAAAQRPRLRNHRHRTAVEASARAAHAVRAGVSE